MTETMLGKRMSAVQKPEPQRMLQKLTGLTMPLSLVILVMIVGAGGWLMVWPKIQEIRALGQAVEAQREYNEKLLGAQQKLQRFLSAYEALQSDPTMDAGVLDAVVPASEDVPGLFVGAENIAQELRLPLKDVHVGEREKSARAAKPSGAGIAGLKEIPYTIAFGGSVDYATYRTILDTLASNQRLMDLHSIAFGGASASGEGKGLAFELTTYTFNPLP